MARKLASIVEIESCDPIQNSDRLSVAKMVGKGWQVVVGRGEFKPGDKCVYFEIDSFLDPKDERYAFLRERCLRKFVSKAVTVLREGLKIKTLKLRGVVSQGLLMPAGVFPEVASAAVGDDVTALLKVEHYDEVAEQLRPLTGKGLAGDVMGPFPSQIPKTDEERIQNLGDWFEKMQGRVWQVTQKHDGMSCTIAYSPSIDTENPEIVCSRNNRMKRETAAGDVPVVWRMAEKYHVLETLKRMYERSGGTEEYALQGEIVGPGIQCDRGGEKDHELRAFRMWRIPEQRYFRPDALVELCRTWGIPHANVVEKEMRFFDEVKTMDDALKFAEGKTPQGYEREGVVLKTVDSGDYASFKIVSNRYLLKEE